MKLKIHEGWNCASAAASFGKDFVVFGRCPFSCALSTYTQRTAFEVALKLLCRFIVILFLVFVLWRKKNHTINKTTCSFDSMRSLRTARDTGVSYSRERRLHRRCRFRGEKLESIFRANRNRKGIVAHGLRLYHLLSSRWFDKYTLCNRDRYTHLPNVGAYVLCFEFLLRRYPML